MFRKPMRPTEIVVDVILDTNIPYTKRNHFELYGEWYIRNGIKGKRVLWDGKHLISDGEVMKNAPCWFLQKFPKSMMDGYLVGYNEIIPKWENVKYILTDIPIYDIIFKKRLGMMKKLAKEYKFIELSHYTLNKNIENHTILQEEFLIKATSKYISIRSEEYIRIVPNFIGWATVVGFAEGTRQLYTKLDKYKCKTKEGRHFYCRKGIPGNIRNMYKFKQTRLINIKDKDNVATLGDKVIYKCRNILDAGKKAVPQEATYIGVLKY